MSNGFDSNQNCSGHASCILAKGLTFVARYYNHPPSAKTLTHGEAKTLSLAGLHLVAVWESGSPLQAAYFSHAQGLQDGAKAHDHAAAVIQQPVSAPIYFAVDFDATAAEIAGPITHYFQGVREALQHAAGSGARYPVGVYGSGLACRTLLDAGFVSFTWLSGSTGWQGHATFAASGDWSIKQTVLETTVCSLNADLDVTQGNGGGFQVT